MRVLDTLSRYSSSLAANVIELAAFEHQSPANQLFRKILCINPMMHALLLYLGGFIEDAKAITDKRHYKNKTMQRVIARIQSISLALNNWKGFEREVAVPPDAGHFAGFNQRVMMIVNSCSGFDKNGYAVRSAQLATALAEQSIHTDFCARFGYPWDIQGRDKLPKTKVSNCDEGQVSLQYDPQWLVGGEDPKYWLAYANYLSSKIKSLPSPPGVLHAHSKYSNAIAAVKAGRELGIPVIYEMRGLWHLTRAQREPTFYESDFYQYEEKLEVWSAKLADAVVVISATLKDWLIQNGIEEEKITVIPNAIDLSNWQNTSGEWKISSGKIKLAFMGSLTPYEGIDTVLRSVDILKKSGNGVSFDIFGDGKYRSNLESLSKKLGLEREVTFHGRVEQSLIKQQIGNFDLFPVVRKDSELTRMIPPLKHLEPMLAGRVVIVSNLPALIDNVPDCVASLAVSAGDPEALTAQIQSLMTQTDLMAEIGRESKKWALMHRNWQKNAQQYRKLYTKVCSDI